MERRLLTGTRRFALLAMVALLAGGLVWAERWVTEIEPRSRAAWCGA